MKAIQIERYGGPDVVELCELPVPTPQAGEVLIKLDYSGINFMDIHTRQGKYAASRTYPQIMPTTLGIEGAGTVVEVGMGVNDFAVDDRVAYCLHWGSHAEYAVVPASHVIPLPGTITLETSAAVLFHGLTAHYLAFDLGKPRLGTTWLIQAASGGIGQLLIQLGALNGVTVYATTSTTEKAKRAQDYGASKVFLHDSATVVEDILESTDGRGVDVVFDPIGAPTLRKSLRVARKKGLVVNFGSVGGNVKDLDPIELGEAGSLFLTRPRLADHLNNSATIRRRARDIFDAVAEGNLRVQIDSHYDFYSIGKSFDILENRLASGKMLLVISSM
ncbi:MAG: quinone oxidoreductase [Rhodovibrionaceae bacterium]